MSVRAELHCKSLAAKILKLNAHHSGASVKNPATGIRGSNCQQSSVRAVCQRRDRRWDLRNEALCSSRYVEYRHRMSERGGYLAFIRAPCGLAAAMIWLVQYGERTRISQIV